MKKLLSILIFGLSILVNVQAQQITEKEVPAAIKSAVTAKAEGRKITMWTLDKKRGKYIATILGDDIFKHIETDLQGKWLRNTQALLPDKVPAAVMATLKTNYQSKGYEVDNFTFIHDSVKGKYYKADVSSDDEDLTLTLDTSGKITHKENR